jgi:hypothetical protein
MGLGWLLPYPNVFTILAIVVLSGWHIFDGCILNRGMDYPDNSIIKGVVASFGFDNRVQDDALSNFMFLFFFGMIVGTFRSCFPIYMKILTLFYIMISLWIFQSGDINKIFKKYVPCIVKWYDG